MSVAWSNGQGGSVVARHEWKGLLKMPGALEDLVEKRRLENLEGSPTRSRRAPSPLDSDSDEYMIESSDEEHD
jgi:hypothetical protein